MSAFVVDDKTINQVVTYLWNGRNLEWTREFLAKQGYDLSIGAGMKKLAVEMFKLNCQAVDARYGKGDSSDCEFEFALIGSVSSIQAYKSLRCWKYQCSEGDVPETALYKIMSKVSDQLAHHIISESKEYNLADWS